MKKQWLVVGVALIAGLLTGCASLEDRAEANDPDAQWQLADRMMRGDGYPQNPGKAKEWLEKAIASENLNAIALKGEFIAGGRYGKNPDIEAALEMMEPAVLQGNNRRIAYGFLKTVFAHYNYNHFPACAKAIESAYGYENDSFEEGDDHRRWELALMFQKELLSFMKGAYDKENTLRLAEQNIYMRGVQSFIDNGRRYNHEWNDREREYGRADEHAFLPEYWKVQAIIAELNRTVEVEGFGASPEDCESNAKYKAVQELCGVTVTSSATSMKSQEVNNKVVNRKKDFKQNTSTQVNDFLESFSTVVKPQIQPDGGYKGVYRAVARETEAKNK